MAPKITSEKRAHKATYASDKRNGGYLIRVVGPHADAFTGREVPVTTANGAEHIEKLTRLVWKGMDVGNERITGTGLPLALYRFEAKPREETTAELF